MGVYVLPVHYYSPLPDIHDLSKNKNIWAKKSQLIGVSYSPQSQVEKLKSTCLPYQDEYFELPAYWDAVNTKAGPGYTYIDAQTLHAMIRFHKPQRVVEVGSGVSTLCMLAASELNKNETSLKTKITCIEPYPSKKLQALTQINLLERTVQTAPLDVFNELQAGDFLFIDSSHTVKSGSDVNYLILEVLPRLNPGVIVHFHDIYLPYDYAPHVLHTFLHWSETALLRAFLTNNPKASILLSMSQMHHEHVETMREVFSEYNPLPMTDGLCNEPYVHFQTSDYHFPTSTYIQIN